MNDAQKLRWNECFVDGSCAPAKKGDAKVGPTKWGKGAKCMVLVDGEGTPLGAYLDAASPAAVQLREATLDTVVVTRPHGPERHRKRPDRLIADRAYDSNAVRALLVRRGTEPIIPARAKNQPASYVPGWATVAPLPTSLDRGTHDWLAGQLPAPNLTIRYDRLMDTDGGLFHLACALITLRKVLK